MQNIGTWAKKPKPHLVFRALRLLAFLWLAVALISAVLAWQLSENAYATTGVVLDVEVIKSQNSDTSYRPVIGFFDHRGAPQTAQMNWDSPDYNFPPGQKLFILADRRSPEIVRLDSLWQVWGEPISLGFSSLIFLVLTSFLAAFSVAKRTKPAPAEKQPSRTYTHLIDHSAEASTKKHTPAALISSQRDSRAPTVRRMR